MAYISSQEQLDKWVAGESIHRDIKSKYKGLDGECCPDFSCCKPTLLAPKEIREMFAKADREGNDKLKHRLLMEFLGKLIAQECGDKKVYIAGSEQMRSES